MQTWPTRPQDDQLQDELVRYLARGPTGAEDARAHLGLSQSAFSRRVARDRRRILVVGAARATRYCLRREISGVGFDAPIYVIDERGESHAVAVLHAIRPQGFYVESLDRDVEAGCFEDLPYFLHDLRPSGFLGRLIPRRHPELGLPGDVQHWTGDQCLAYLTQHGWNLSGNLIVGDAAFRAHLLDARTRTEHGTPARRRARYLKLANDVLQSGPPGSSVAGEQPKFLTTRMPGPTDVLVKFSPAGADAASRRVADLLVAEHLVHETLRAHGRQSARSQILHSGGHTFFEVERFDRVVGPARGRRGMLSMFALDAQFVGHLVSWIGTARELLAQGRIDQATLEEIAWRGLFGRLIADVDMHQGNLSFFMSGTRIAGLTPVYDMSPTKYVPRHGHVPQEPMAIPLPEVWEGSMWSDACSAAIAFWMAVAEHTDVSRPFRRIAAENQRAVKAGITADRRLPMRRS